MKIIFKYTEKFRCLINKSSLRQSFLKELNLLFLKIQEEKVHSIMKLCNPQMVCGNSFGGICVWITSRLEGESEIKIQGISMTPIIQSGDTLILSQKMSQTKIGDIILFYSNSELVRFVMPFFLK